MPIMQQSSADFEPQAVPTTKDMLRAWNADRCVQRSSANVYLQWIKLSRAYILQRGLDERTELTLAGARRFSAWYAPNLYPEGRLLDTCTCVASTMTFHMATISSRRCNPSQSV